MFVATQATCCEHRCCTKASKMSSLQRPNSSSFSRLVKVLPLQLQVLVTVRGCKMNLSCALMRVCRHSHQKSLALVDCRPRNEGTSAGELCRSAFTHRQVGIMSKSKMQAMGVSLFSPCSFAPVLKRYTRCTGTQRQQTCCSTHKRWPTAFPISRSRLKKSGDFCRQCVQTFWPKPKSRPMPAKKWW